MKTTKNIFSAILALSMVFGTVSFVSADSNEITELDANTAQSGTGSSEGFISTELLRVVLPTQSLDYIVDAQGLIKKSYATGTSQNHKGDTIVYSTKNAAKVVTDAKTLGTADNNVLNDGFVFFTSESKSKKTLSNYVDLVIENKSTYNVDITPVLEFVPGTGGMTATKWTTTAGDDSLAFNLTEKESDGKTTTYKPIIEEGAETAKAITVGNASSCYTTEYDSTGKTYNYSLSDSLYTKAKLNNTVTYTLEAFSNKDKVTEDNAAKPGKIQITWQIAKTPDPDTNPEP